MPSSVAWWGTNRSKELVSVFEVTVQLDGKPLRHTFVSYNPDFADPTFALTDDVGRAEFPDVKSTATIDVVVHAHNLAVRMLDGTTTSTTEKSLRFSNKKNKATLNVTKRNKTFAYYDIMDRCYDVYETVFRPIAPFTSRSRQTFPFGASTAAAHELKRRPKVDCRFPEMVAPGKLPWVQPQSVTGGRPLMHLKPQTTDSRLFGTASRPATTISHEFAHAIHFALLSTLNRWLLAAKYGLWIATELASGNSGTHRTDKKTAPLIAYVESIGIFSQRFYLFATEVRPDLHGAPLRRAFVEDELSGSPSLVRVLPGYKKIATRQANGKIKPHLTGASTEGAVYGAIFLDFASRTTLATAVHLYLRCGGFDVGDYITYARKQRKGNYRKDLGAVAATWKL